MNESKTFSLVPVHIAVVCLAFAVSPAVAQDAPRALCYLDSFEVEMEEDSAMRHAAEMEVKCAHAERAIIDVAGFDLQYLDGDADLLEAGEAWLEAYEEAGSQGFFSSSGKNTIEVSDLGRNRTIELTAHSHAIPATGVATLQGTVDLVVEADCVGADAVEFVTVETTAGALSAGTAIAIEGGGEVMATEQGLRGDTPMLGIKGSGSYIALIEPPEGVIEYNFMGSKRIIVEETAAEDAPVTMQICPTEVVTVPVSIEASI